MNVDSVDFFRQVTLRICGSFIIEKALFETYRYLSQYLPVDEISYVHFDAEMKAIQFVACATREGGMDMGLAPMPLMPRLVDVLKRDISQSDYSVISRADENPYSRAITEFRAMAPDTSVILIRLRAKGEFLGSLNIACAGAGRYTNEQGALMATVGEPLSIALANSLQYREVLRLKDLQAEDSEYLKNELKNQFTQTIIGADFGLKEVMARIRQVAGAKSPVLLQSETGTEKMVIAHAIHNLSRRNAGPFMPINCGAIPGSLIESELFGHEKGAFSGAISSYCGRLERANGGTVFLDEIGELPPGAQMRLLKVLQEQEVRRTGSSVPVKIDIRVVAATHRDLNAMVAEGAFRQDLFFRLKVFPVIIPPLRERKSDIPALAQHFLEKKCRELGIKNTPAIARDFLDRLLSYDWPGNARELENVIERALIINREGPLTGESFVDVSPVCRFTEDVVITGDVSSLDEAMRQHIQKAMKQCNGRIEGHAGVAGLLGIKPNTLRARMRKLGIEYGRRSSGSA